MMSQFQTFMDKHNVQNDATVKASIQTEYGNQDNFSDTNKSINDMNINAQVILNSYMSNNSGLY